MVHHRNEIYERSELIPPGYVLRLDMDGDFVDKSPNHNDGELNPTIGPPANNLPSFTAGRNGKQCADFSGDDNVACIPATGFADSVAQKTIACWLKMSGSGTYSLFNSRSHYLYQNSFLLRIESGIVKIYGGASGYVSQASVSINDGLWHHVLIEISHYNFIRIYVDGTRVDTSTGSLTYLNWDYLTIGHGVENGGPLVGQVQNVIVYPRLLTPSEKQMLLT